MLENFRDYGFQSAIEMLYYHWHLFSKEKRVELKSLGLNPDNGGGTQKIKKKK